MIFKMRGEVTIAIIENEKGSMVTITILPEAQQTQLSQSKIQTTQTTQTTQPVQSSTPSIQSRSTATAQTQTTTQTQSKRRVGRRGESRRQFLIRRITELIAQHPDLAIHLKQNNIDTTQLGMLTDKQLKRAMALSLNYVQPQSQVQTQAGNEEDIEF